MRTAAMEYRAAMRSAMIAADPSVSPILDKIDAAGAAMRAGKVAAPAEPPRGPVDEPLRSTGAEAVTLRRPPDTPATASPGALVRVRRPSLVPSPGAGYASGLAAGGGRRRRPPGRRESLPGGMPGNAAGAAAGAGTPGRRAAGQGRRA